MGAHEVRARHENPDDNEAGGAQNSVADDDVTLVEGHEEEAGEPDGPADEEADGRAEEAHALAVVARYWSDEAAGDEEQGEQEDVVAWKERQDNSRDIL